jgi:hypothetical protein
LPLVSTDSRLLAVGEADAARYGRQRFVAQPLGLEGSLEAIEEMIAVS